MKCKNCQIALSEEQQYCPSCGAKIVTERITLRGLFHDFSENVLGWDNRYFVTFKMMFLRPEVVFKEYLDGTRKKFAAPLTAFTIVVAMALIAFNQFADHYLAIAQDSNGIHLHADTTTFVVPIDTTYSKLEATPEERKEHLDEVEKMRQAHLVNQKTARKFVKINQWVKKATIKYYNVFAFFLLPFYTLIAFWVYGKPYNFAEHLVINVFIQAMVGIVSLTIFLLSVWIHPGLYKISLLFTVLYYLYVYGRLYGLGFGQSLLKLLRFLIVLFVSGLVVIILVLIVGFVVGFLFSI